MLTYDRRGACVCAAAVALAGLLWPTLASAATAKLPVQIVDRTLVMPEDTLRFDAGPRWPYYDAQFKQSVHRGPDDQFLNPGLSFGLAKDFELGFVAPIRIAPNSGFEDPRVHLQYQFEQGRVDASIFSSLQLGVLHSWVLTAGVPVFFHWKNNLRLDTGGFLVMGFGDVSAVSLQGPLSFVFQVSPRFYAGPETGINLNGVGHDHLDVNIPVGGFLGYTLTTSGGTLGDLYGRVRLPDIESGFDVVELMFGCELYFDM
ncbi:MAG TPA: hypothetical protein VHM70_00095 [Polyangiaceae bacterium]|jgi:hypothetical protein|nr:hypothetical protein [Polyangiaceae bacterium]